MVDPLQHGLVRDAADRRAAVLRGDGVGGYFYLVSQRELFRDWWTRLKYLPFLMSLGIGLA